MCLYNFCKIIWVSDSSLTAILWGEQVRFWWDDDDVCYILDQHI